MKNVLLSFKFILLFFIFFLDSIFLSFFSFPPSLQKKGHFSLSFQTLLIESPQIAPKSSQFIISLFFNH